MPKIIEVEYTSDSNIARFILSEPIAAGLPKNFSDKESAQHNDLAKNLFNVNHVTSVSLQGNYVIITKDNEIIWRELLPKLAPPIRKATSSFNQIASDINLDQFKLDEDDELIKKIRIALNATILPIMAADGGGLDVLGRNGKQIMIRYYGACQSCPSGLTGTLMAIEDVLRKEVDAEIVVVPV